MKYNLLMLLILLPLSACKQKPADGNKMPVKDGSYDGACLWNNTAVTPNLKSCTEFYNANDQQVQQQKNGCPTLPGGTYIETKCELAGSVGKCSANLQNISIVVYYYAGHTVATAQADCLKYSGLFTSL